MFNNIGIIQKRKGDVEAAIKSYEAALQADPQAFFPNYNLAVLLATEGKYDRAVMYFQEALSRCTDPAQELNVILNLALCFEQQKKLKLAIETLDQGLKKDPANSQI